MRISPSRQTLTRSLAAALLCTAVALPSAAQRNADSEPERIQPPALENPGKSSGLLPLAVVIVGLALAVAPAVIPSKRAHGE